LLLYDPSVTQVGSDNDSGGSRNSLLTYQADVTGTYYLGARDAGNGVGGYTFSVTSESTTDSGGETTSGSDDYPWSTSTTGVVSVDGASASGEIEVSGDNDLFKVDLVAGTTYVFNLSRTSSGGLSDPYLLLYDPSVTQVGSDNDSGGSRNSLLTYQADVTGTYYLGARDASNGTGIYMLSAVSESVIDDYPSTTDTSGVVIVDGAETRGLIEAIWDLDLFRVDLIAGINYEFSVTKSSSGGLTDPYLYLYDSALTPIREDDDSAGSLNSRINFQPNQTGFYYLGVKDNSTGTGSYSVWAISEIASDDYPWSMDTQGRVSINSDPTVGKIEISGDKDVFKLNLVSGTKYTFELSSMSSDGLNDPYLILLDASFNELESDDDGGGSRNARITYEAGKTGIYYLGAKDRANGIGGYSLSAQSEISTQTDSEFNITIIFEGDERYQRFFDAAAARWQEIITGDLPDTVARGNEIDDLLIYASVIEIDGAYGILGWARPEEWRANNAGGLTSIGMMQFDTADLEMMEAKGTLGDVILHEMGHIFGFPAFIDRFGLAEDYEYKGVNALRAYRELTGNSTLEYIPLADGSTQIRPGSHWKESVFNEELMTGFAESMPPMPISIVTIGMLEDLGYSVNYSAADGYSIFSGMRSTVSLTFQQESQNPLSSAHFFSIDDVLGSHDFSGSIFSYSSNKGLNLKVDATQAKLTGVVTSSSSETIYILGNFDGYSSLIRLDGDFEKNSPTLTTEIKGTVKRITFLDEYSISSTYLQYQTATEVQKVINNWYGEFLFESNIIEVISTSSTDDYVDSGNGDDFIILGAGDDILIGGPGRDMLYAGTGDDFLDGGDGLDTAVFTGAKDEYSLTLRQDGDFEIVSISEGSDTFTNIERLQFADLNVALDFDDTASKTSRILGAFLGAAGIEMKEIAGTVIQMLDAGVNYRDLLQLAINATVGSDASGESLVSFFYFNLIGSAAPAELIDAYASIINSGSLLPVDLAMQVSESDLNAENIDLIGLSIKGLEYTI